MLALHIIGCFIVMISCKDTKEEFYEGFKVWLRAGDKRGVSASF